MLSDAKQSNYSMNSYLTLSYTNYSHTSNSRQIPRQSHGEAGKQLAGSLGGPFHKKCHPHQVVEKQPCKN